MMYYGYPYGYNWSFGLLHALFIILVIGLFIAALRLIFGGMGSLRWRRRHHLLDALDILRERYAKGEISREEFEEKKRDLSH